MVSSIRFLMVCVLAACVSCGCTPTTDEITNKATETFNTTKDRVEKTAPEIVEWTEEDLRKIGAWEYHQFEAKFAETSPEQILEKLNELGADRWECFWVQDIEDGVRFYLKRSKRSYLRYVPVGEVVRSIMPDGN